MTTTSSVSSSSSSVNLGNAQDVSSLTAGGVTLSLAEAVTTKVQPFLDRADAVQTEINTNHTQIAAYQNMQSLLQALQAAAANLTTESLAGTNVFQARAADLASSSSTPANSILTAAVANGTATGTHSVIVKQLAQTEADTSSSLNLASADPISNLGGALASGGSFTIAEVGKATPASITVTSGMTLTQVAAAINGATNTTGVSASVVTVDSTHQVMVLSGQDPDTPLTFSDPNGLLTQMGIVSGSSSNTVTGAAASPPADETAPMNLSGSFTVHVGAQAVPITVTANESLDDIATSIHDASSGAISASVDSSNQLVLSAGSTLTFSDAQGGVLAALGIGSVAVNQVRQAQSLNLTVDGVQNITRDTNTVSDVLNGVTLNVTQFDPHTTVTVNINPDANTAATAIQSFVTAYNSWESFVSANEATDSSGNAAASAVLFGDSTLREASLQVDTAVTANINNTLLGENSSLGALGISLNGANQMQIDATTLDDALNNNFTQVANLFQATLSTSSPNLVPSGSNLSTFSGNFTFEITTNASGDISGVTMNSGQSIAGKFLIVGNSIQGQFGTPYSGMFFNYAGTPSTTQSVTVNSTQGIANQVYTAANNFGNATSGSVQTLITDKQSQDIQFTSQFNSFINEANNFADFLVTQYSSLTTQIQTAGQTLSTLTALMNADNRN